nr:retrovirus-related Pol polyprotein from transposon TNT 1-94 [Tanacetum cinerariifolium]
MQTKSSSKLTRDQTSNPASSTNTTPNGRTRRSSKQKVENSNFEEHLPPIATRADNRTMAEMLRAPTEGYAEEIVVPSILAEQFELSTAWERYKDLLCACPHHGITEFHQLDIFYNALNPADQDSLNAAAGGNLLEKSPQDTLTIIENKSKVCNSQSKPIASQVKACDVNSSSEIAKLTHAVNQQTSAVTTAMMAMLKQLQANPPPAPIKAVEETCVTCGGAHPYYQCLAADGNTFLEFRDNIQGYVSAAAGNYNQGNPGYRPQGVANQMRPPGSGSLPSNTVANPKGKLKSITTRSGLVTDGPTVPTPIKSVTPEVGERVEETYRDPDLAEYTIKVPPPPALVLMPKYQKMLKALLSNKEKLQELANTPLNENCSAVILKKLPEKLDDPGKFLILYGFSELKCEALADLGASINLMPLSIWKEFGLPELIPTRMTFELANRAICTPDGIARDVFVSVGKTARALIDVHGEEMILRDGDERLTLNMKHDTANYSNNPQRESINLINIFNVSKGCNDIHPHFDDDPLSDTTTYSSNSLLEEFTDELALITYPSDYDDNLQFDIESDLKEIEFLLYQVDSDNDNVYDDPFNSKGEKIKESKLLIDELDLPCDFLPYSEYDLFNSQDFSRVDAFPSTDNEDKVKERQEKDKIRTKPNKNKKRGKARQSHIESCEPINYLEAISSPKCDKWVVTMEKEVKDGIPKVERNRYKARYIVRGFDQREGIDFNEVFSLVVCHTFIRVLLSIVALQDLELEQLDVKTTFFHGHLEEEIYAEQPEGFKVHGKEDHVCRLKKSLYGLKQSPRQWYKRFDSFMIGHGYDRCSYDECVYFQKFTNGSFLYLVLYVDDMLIAAPNKDQIRELKDQLSTKFDVKDLGATKRILGMEFQRDQRIGKLTLSQTDYISKVLKKFNMSSCKPVPTPLAPHFKLSSHECLKSEEDKEDMSRIPYSSTISSLMYAMVCTRPDFAHAVSVVSRYMHNPGKMHWETVKCILRYLKETSNIGLSFEKGHASPKGVVAYVNSDYAGDLDARKSLSSYIFSHCGSAISW